MFVFAKDVWVFRGKKVGKKDFLSFFTTSIYTCLEKTKNGTNLYKKSTIISYNHIKNLILL